MLVLLSGVSGAGKDTIKKELIKRMGNVTSMPSYTDRKPREGEENGKIYHYHPYSYGKTCKRYYDIYNNI